MKSDVLRIGSRGSELALWQARWVRTELKVKFPDLQVHIETIKTKGDKILDSPLSKIGDKGLFTKEIEQSLLDRTIDIAIHSLKDLPTELPAGLTIGAVCKREDVRDVFIPHPSNPRKLLHKQEQGARIATGSLRRRCQLLHLRPDFEIIDIRGNLNTRLKKLEESDWAGMILAKAGVVRLGWEKKIGETVDTNQILPAVGQGALAVEVRADDRRTNELVSVLNHTATAQATEAERALLRTLEGGCQVPIGAFGRVELNENGAFELKLDALVGSLDGRNVVRGTTHGGPEDGEALGRQLAETLLAGGADKILRVIRGHVPEAVVQSIGV